MLASIRGTAPDLSSTLTRLGRFEIRRELGQGGYGIVFLAHHPQLGREVALKIPRPDTLVTPELRIRFHQEAQAAAGLASCVRIPLLSVNSQSTRWLRPRGGPSHRALLERK